jgi:hypothetical protein
VAATLALVALIGYGVATSSSSGRAAKVAPVTSTTVVTPTTQQIPPTIVPAQPPVPYYAADVGPTLKIQFADFNDYSPLGTGYQLWATPGSTATSGSWFSVTSADGFGGQSDLYTPNAYRLDTDRGRFTIVHMSSGQTAVQFSAPTISLSLMAFGWSDADLVRLVESINLGSITLGQRQPVFSDPSLISGYELISNGVDPWLAIQGMTGELLYYTDATDPNGGLSITVGRVDATRDEGPILDRKTALQFLVDHATPFMVDGQQAVAGALIDQNGYALASWTDGDVIVTVAGKVPVPRLISIARTVHEASKAEWDDMRLMADKNASEANIPSSYSEPAQVPVSFGTDGNGESWTIQVGLGNYGNFQQIIWGWGTNGTGTTSEDTAQINTVVDGDRTYVLADLPRPVAPTAQLRVTRNGLDPVDVPFNDTHPTADRTFAAYAFSEPGPYTAQVIGADGAVLATWPST